MAATSKGTRSRLDLGFGAAISEALFDTDIVQDEQKENKINEATEPERELEATEVKKETVSAPLEEPKQESAKPQTEIASETQTVQASNNSFSLTNDSADFLLHSLPKNERGVQKSIYLKNDVYNFIQDKADKYNMNFSSVINILLEAVINNKTN